VGVPAVRVQSGVATLVDNVAGSKLGEETGGGAASWPAI